MNTLKELQDFAVQENIGLIADKTVKDIEEIAEACVILPHLAEINLISQKPPFPLDNAYFIKHFSEL
jgi:hypothetical protein